MRREHGAFHSLHQGFDRMFISVTFPLADFRGLHPEKCGRLDRPAWGNADPRATFARGFGAIHTRNKPGGRFVGENYYADCNSLLKYPSQMFLDALPSLPQQKVLTYPLYKRLYFDGQFSGRFEFGFRLNEATIQNVSLMPISHHYDISAIARQLLTNIVLFNLPDTRKMRAPFFRASNYLRDGYIMSSTKQRSLAQYDVASVASSYVSVGAPFIFIRSSVDTPITPIRQRRDLLRSDDFSLFKTRLGVQGRNFDVLVLESERDLMSESAKERLARLFYSQIRAIMFAHSHYIAKVDERKFPPSHQLVPAIAAMIERIRSLVPVEGDLTDRQTCQQLRSMLGNSDVDVNLLAKELEQRLKKRRLPKMLHWCFSYLDRKADKAIEAAASTATVQVLGAGR